jgi:hypothetical protein
MQIMLQQTWSILQGWLVVEHTGLPELEPEPPLLPPDPEPEPEPLLELELSTPVSIPVSMPVSGPDSGPLSRAASSGLASGPASCPASLPLSTPPELDPLLLPELLELLSTGGSHCPAAHVSPVEHLNPHFPQLSGSSVRLAQYAWSEPQSVWPPMHAPAARGPSFGPSESVVASEGGTLVSVVAPSLPEDDDDESAGPVPSIPPAPPSDGPDELVDPHAAWAARPAKQTLEARRRIHAWPPRLFILVTPQAKAPSTVPAR